MDKPLHLNQIIDTFEEILETKRQEVARSFFDKCTDVNIDIEREVKELQITKMAYDRESDVFSEVIARYK